MITYFLSNTCLYLNNDNTSFTDWTILIDNVEFIPLYDVPHVLKCMRNNFLNKNIEIDFDAHLKDEDRKVASWNHIITAYEIDVHGDLIERHVPDLTEQHVYPGKINKMKVKHMMQVFSKKMFCFVDLLAKASGKFCYFFH